MDRNVKPGIVIVFLSLAATALVASQSHGQSWGRNTEMVWRCGKCKGLVGSGPNAPSLCPHCKSKLVGSKFGWRSGSSGSSGSTSPTPPTPRSAGTVQNDASSPSVATALVIGVIILTMAGLVGLVLKQAS